MTDTAHFLDRAAHALPRATFAHWLIRLPLAGVLLQYGIGKFPLSEAEAAGFGVPLVLWALAGLGEIGAALLLILGGFLRGGAGDIMTRVAGAGIAVIVAGVVYVAYWAPPLDLLMFNQFHLLLLAGGLHFALAGNAGAGRAGG
jgi:uncharacterized membrane protein YphA (DoxX/SURF4 family)